MDIINNQVDLREKDSIMDIIVDAFHKYGVPKAYKKNEFIFRENDLPNSAYYVDSGLIKISQSSQEGQGITLFLRSAGEIRPKRQLRLI
jgi:hypothetical protein